MKHGRTLGSRPIALVALASLAATLACGRAAAQPVIHESATVGQVGQTTGGASISATQYIGTRFQLGDRTEVGFLGGHFYVPPGSNGEMFAAVMRLDSLSSLPSGDPFNASDLARVVYSTRVTVDSSSSRDYFFPATFTLDPGVYGLIYGKGQFGASAAGSVGAANGGQNLSPHYMLWNDQNTPGWDNGGFPNARLTVYAVPEPTAAALAAGACCLLLSPRRRRGTAAGGAALTHA
jgi:hypothetical protein